MRCSKCERARKVTGRMSGVAAPRLPQHQLIVTTTPPQTSTSLQFQSSSTFLQSATQQAHQLARLLAITPLAPREERAALLDPLSFIPSGSPLLTSSTTKLSAGIRLSQSQMALTTREQRGRLLASTLLCTINTPAPSPLPSQILIPAYATSFQPATPPEHVRAL